MATDHFMVNVLAQDQADIALRFAQSGVDRFQADDTVPLELGLPGIEAAAARVACAKQDVLDGGDHSILIGRVEATQVGAGTPLVYCGRAFLRPTALPAPPLPPAPATAQPVVGSPTASPAASRAS